MADEPLIAYFAHEKQDAAYWGALVLVTLEGDPVDFAYTEPVVLGRFASRLLGHRAEAHMVGLLLAPLLEQARPPARLVCFDDAVVLTRRLRLATAAVVLAADVAPHKPDAWTLCPSADAGTEPFWVASDTSHGVPELVESMRAAMAPFGIRDPFRQLRAAMAELRPGSAG